jgi:FAD dependent oxidoreductase
VAVMMKLLQPHIDAGRLTLHLRTKAAAAEVQQDRVASVTTVSLEGSGTTRFLPGVILDATELGDLLPLVGAEYSSGAETIAETGEPHAQPIEPKPHCVQSFTYVFGLERRPQGERHVSERPARYDLLSCLATVQLAHRGSWRRDLRRGERLAELQGLRGHAAHQGRPVDLSPLGRQCAVRLELLERPVDVQLARQRLPGSEHWVQTEAPAEADRLGAPELRLRPDIMGTADGLAKFPYIREARRIKALRPVVEQDVSAHFQKGPAAAPFDDSVGVGWYPIDIHRAGPEDVGISCRTRPFQIPLGTLIPVRIPNLIAAAKNIGTTHITNGCYRLHPVEWNVGESAGALAAFCLEQGTLPAAIYRNAELRSDFQRSLVSEGVPLIWTTAF